MKLIIFISILTQCYCAYSAASFRYIREGKITGGHESKPNGHPYLVSLQLRFLWTRSHVCGGSIINDKWVLTAAHCIRDSFLLRWLPLDAVAGTHDVDYFASSAQINPVAERIAHPQYAGDIGPYDIALLRGSKPFIFTDEVLPIYLPYNYEVSNNLLTLAGWGALRTTYFIPDLPSRLHEVKVTYIPYDKCYNAVEKLLEDDETNPLDKKSNICTGPLSGGIAACNGDSGGPLIQLVPLNAYNRQKLTDDYEEYDKNYNEERSNQKIKLLKGNETNDVEIPVILGVVSWGMAPCGFKGAPTVYTKVSTYIDFIERYAKL